MTEKNTKLVVVILNRQQLEFLEELKEKTGFGTSMILRNALIEYHRKNIRDYLSVANERMKLRGKPKEIEAVEEIKFKQKEAKSKVREESVYLKGKKIAALLDGKTFKEGDTWYCTFTCYEYMNPTYVHEGLMTLPFEELTPELVTDAKWKGGREKIEAVLKNKVITK